MNWKGTKKFTRRLCMSLVALSLLLGMAGTAVWAADTTAYIIKSGDTLLKVSRAHDTTLDELMGLNPDITDPNAIYVGQTIQVPEEKPPGTAIAQCPLQYTIQAGDTWTSIAQAHEVKPGILALVNNKVLSQTPVTGSTLCIPQAPSTAPSTPESVPDEPAAPTKTATPVTPVTPVKTPAPVTPAKTPAPVAPAKTPAPVAPATALPNPGEGAGRWYTIARGDYLSRVAGRNGCTTRVLSAVNKITNPSIIHTGTRIWIPNNCARLTHLVPAIPLPPAPVRPAPVPPAPPVPPRPSVPTAPAPPTVPSAPSPPPAPSSPTGGALSTTYQGQGPWTGHYYEGIELAGRPIVSRTDRQIAFHWGVTPPATGVPADRFSTRWTGEFHFNGDEHRFMAIADDGVRVWIDNILLIDGWKEQARTLYYRDYTPRYGTHTVRVEYYDTWKDATVIVNWAPTRR